MAAQHDIGAAAGGRYGDPMAEAAYDRATALVVVDVQNDFADPGGSLAVPGAEAVVPAVNGEIAAAREAGAAVVYTQDWHPPRTPHFVTDGGPWPVHCVRETWGAEFHPRLLVTGPAVHKGTGGEDGYSGFTMRDTTTGEDRSTGLDELLRERDVERVVVVGLALDYCVKATALDAVRLGYADVVVPRATTAPVEVAPGDGARAEAELIAAGVQIV
jgi:nicotinamidase/pyrazinamidase